MHCPAAIYNWQTGRIYNCIEILFIHFLFNPIYGFIQSYSNLAPYQVTDTQSQVVNLIPNPNGAYQNYIGLK